MNHHHGNNKMHCIVKDILLRDLCVVLSYARDISRRVAAWEAKVPWDYNIETELMDICFEDLNYYA